MKTNRSTFYLTILLFGFLARQALCSYNEVKFTMSRSYLIDTEGFAKFNVKADVYYKYSSTFFEIIIRDPEYDTYQLKRTQNNGFEINATHNHSNTNLHEHSLHFNNYFINFPLDIDEKVFNFSLTYDNQTYSSITNNKINKFYEIVNDSFILNSQNDNILNTSQMKMQVSVLNNNLMINISNLPIFFNNHTNSIEINNNNNTNNNVTINESQSNTTSKNKRKRRRNKVITKEFEDPRKRFYEITIGFSIFKKLQIKSDKLGSKIAYYPLHYKTCDFCRSSKNLSKLHNFAFKFDLEGHQNDQLFKFGKQQRKCIIEDEIDLYGNPLKFNITENATNKYTFYGFLLKLRLVKFPIYSVIDDDNFSLPTKPQNDTELNKSIISDNFQSEIKNVSQFMKISVMPKSHRIMILLDDNNEFWQTELENSLINHFPNSVHLIGHLHIDETNMSNQNQFNNFNEINFDINANLNQDNETVVENISKIIKMYKPDIIINFINETENIIFDINEIYKIAFPENSTIDLNDILYIKNQGNLSFDPAIIDLIHQFDFSNSSIETNCGTQLKSQKFNEKYPITNKRNQFTFLLPNKCMNCTFSFNNRTFYSWNASIFPSKILFNTLINKKEKKGLLSKKIEFSTTNKEEFFIINNEIFYNSKKINDFEILGPRFNSTQIDNKNIKINLINDCNKCDDFAKICAIQYREEYLLNETLNS